MSHFTVLVIGPDPESQLAPFDENLELPRHLIQTKAQIIQEERKRVEKYKANTYAKYLENPEKYESECKNEEHIAYLKNEFPKKLNWTDEDFYKEGTEWNEPEDFDEEGNIWGTSNEKAKWDWFQLGGRWTGAFVLKPNTSGTVGEYSLISGVRAEVDEADQAIKGDIDFDAMREKQIISARKNYRKFLAEPEDRKKAAMWMYGVKMIGDRIQTEEEYIQDSIGFSTFAVLLNGEWYEKGKMGWFGVVHDEKESEQWESEFKKLLDGLPDDTLLSVYDCHI